MATKSNVIPKHCQENWLELNSEEKVRFCTLCQKNVFESVEENTKITSHFCERYHSNLKEVTVSNTRKFFSKATEFILKNRAK
jgi:hypothetical protein